MTPEILNTPLSDAILRCILPRSKEELWWYCREQLRVVCETCKGAKRYYGPKGVEVCQTCQGKGTHGFHLARTAVCPGHSAPLDVLWKFYSGEARLGLIVAVRAGGKTRFDAILEHLLARFKRFTVSHMGGSDAQAQRCRAHLKLQTEGDPAFPFVYDTATKEPVPPGNPAIAVMPELTQDSPTKVVWYNGGVVEFLPGTTKQASGPHSEVSVLDEVDETTPDVEQKFSKTAAGPRAIYLLTSTHTYATGTVASIKRDQPHIPIFTWCMFEALARCTTPCDSAPMPDGSVGKCPLFEEEVITKEGRREIQTLCGGELARRSDGFVPLNAAIRAWLSSNPYTRGVELLCRSPELGLGAGLAYWAYAPDNVLPFDPATRWDAPLEWTMDFNPGVGQEMCSLILQQAPPDYPGEWWVIDEIALPTSSTPATAHEFLRRYGRGGAMLQSAYQEKGHPGGVWVYGDATGHARKSTTGETDYEVILALLQGVVDLQLRIPYGEANPPLVNRLNRTNEVLWDAITKRRTLRVAPRCVRLRDELARMPLKAGTREKDKSQQIQRLGLSHLGDALEYWVWMRFPGGVNAVPVETILRAAGERASAGKGQEWLTGQLGRDSGGGTRSSSDFPFTDRKDSGWR